MAKITCPVCGKEIDESDMEFLENGNPACRQCVSDEEKRNELKKQEKIKNE